LNIAKAEKKDFLKIKKLIESHKSLVGLPLFSIEKKFDCKNFALFKAVKGSEFLGFAEIEFLEGNEARINCIALTEIARGKKTGSEFLSLLLSFLIEKKIERVAVLVLESNSRAISLFEKTGFSFTGLLLGAEEKEVLEMELDFSETTPTYIS